MGSLDQRLAAFLLELRQATLVEQLSIDIIRIRQNVPVQRPDDLRFPTLITSLQNQRVKEIIKLNKRSERDRHRLTVVEGRRECAHALAAVIKPVQAFLCSQLLGHDFEAVYQDLQAAGIPATHIFDTAPNVYAKMAYRGDSGGIILAIPYFDRPLHELLLNPSPLLLMIEGAEKPGNLGAILRTADAAGVDAVIVLDVAHPDADPGAIASTATDIHNPNTIRASLGAVFMVPVAATSPDEAAAYLHRRGITLIAATPHTDDTYWDIDMRGPVAILLGSEAHGLSQFWLDAAHIRARLPMHGAIDSLNLSAATAIILYEALRQRAKLSHS